MREFLAVLGKVFLPPAKAAWVFLVAVAANYWLAAPAGLHTLAFAVLAMFVIDTLSGSFLSFKTKRFSSRKFGASLTKLIVYGFAVAATIPLGNVLALGHAVTTLGLMLIFIREATSVLENLKQLGFPLPSWIGERLHEMREACETDPTGSRATRAVTRFTSTCETSPTEYGEREVCETEAVREV